MSFEIVRRDQRIDDALRQGSHVARALDRMQYCELVASQARHQSPLAE
jgi:hypothetical protein